MRLSSLYLKSSETQTDTTMKLTAFRTLGTYLVMMASFTLNGNTYIVTPSMSSLSRSDLAYIPPVNGTYLGTRSHPDY